MGNAISEFIAKLRALLRLRGGQEDDFAEEIDHHIESIAETYISRGMSRDAAYQAARREFGNPARTAEKARESWKFRPVDEFAQDLRYALRGMRRAPVLSAVIVSTLALGIGANTAIFSVVHGVLLEPLPYPAADRLVWMGESTKKSAGISVTWVNYTHWLAENHSAESMAAFRFDQKIVTGKGEPALAFTAAVTGEFPQLLGMRAQAGRLLAEPDDRAGAPPVVVLSDAFWKRHFGSDPAIVNSTLDLDGAAYQVVGIAAPLWQFAGKDADIFVSLGRAQASVTDRSQHGSIRALARLKSGVTLNQARADFDGIMDRLAKSDPGPEAGHRAFARLLSEQVTGEVSDSLWALMAAVGLLLMIACANVAGLLVARNLARSSEIAIRMAIGAGRGRLIRELLTESLTFACIGGICGVFVAGWCASLLLSIAPAEIPRLGPAGVRGEVLAFAIAVTLVTGLLAGLAPVWSAWRGINLAEMMQGSARSATSNRSSVSIRAFLVAGQIAVTLVLVFVAAVLLRSLGVAQNRNPGFEPGHLLALEAMLPEAAYPPGHSQVAFYEQLRENIAGLPEVESAALVKGPPALGARTDWFYSIDGKPLPKQGDVPVAVLNMAGPGYFSTARIGLRGREFTSLDRAGAPCTAVINQTLSRSGEVDLGGSVKVGGPYMKGDLCEVVGIAADISQDGLDQEVRPEIYLPFARSPSSTMAVMIRTRADGDSEALGQMIREQVKRLGPAVPVLSLRPVTTLLKSRLDRRRFGTFLLAAFAGLALALAAIGIYGLLDFWVGMRRREIALRLALGASRSAILKWSGWQTARLVLIGCVLGLAAAYASSRWLESLVYGVPADDIRLLAAAAATVMALGGVASAIPLWRAVRVDEADQLRQS